MSRYSKIAQLKTVAALRERLDALGVEIPLDDDVLTAEQGSPLAEPLQIGPLRAGNRWCIHPMEGWDAEADGSPSPLTLRRWRNFGRSGAKLIWGGEAAAVQPDGRANPRQTLATSANRHGLSSLLTACQEAHAEQFGKIDDLLVGLQLTHSGRFSRPHSKAWEPRIAYHHPLLDPRCGIDPGDDSVVWTDDDLETLIDNYVVAAGLAWEAGFRFVDVKACHGYLLHEFLGARSRPGPYGGDFAGRTRLLRTIIGRIRQELPELQVVVRLSAFDSPPYIPDGDSGRPVDYAELLPYSFGFGVDAQNPLDWDLAEPIALIQALHQEGVVAVNVTCGSPYYNPHMQRPAIFPPSDGYQPPEDPLVGVARQIQAVRALKQAAPEMPLVGTGYSYLQDYLPHAAQAVVRAGWVDAVGLGRMVLSYPELPADTLSQGTMARKKICRTFSDCTTAPRNGIISGCFPLDPFYKAMPEAKALLQVKKEVSQAGKGPG
ncbi:oxidoreductase [Lignipirellula cremea]|uniref:NADPH dehydrogenase n=1 Tax=Lignipirellula cremea TaxID=2528010 RepID=A0A518DZI7_9BACT|nr:NADH:flavin oxidoreductase [Lignipirellula cremea]QDU97257.1 NADPH dehydrogenase [Lignipirellula cremea]